MSDSTLFSALLLTLACLLGPVAGQRCRLSLHMAGVFRCCCAACGVCCGHMPHRLALVCHAGPPAQLYWCESLACVREDPCSAPVPGVGACCQGGVLSCCSFLAGASQRGTDKGLRRGPPSYLWCCCGFVCIAVLCRRGGSGVSCACACSYPNHRGRGWWRGGVTAADCCCTVLLMWLAGCCQGTCRRPLLSGPLTHNRQRSL